MALTKKIRRFAVGKSPSFSMAELLVVQASPRNEE